MHSRQRRVTPNNPIRTTHTAEGAWGIVPLWEMRFEDALLPIRRQIKTTEERLYKKKEMEPSITLDSIPQKIIYSLFCQFQNCVVIELQYVDAFREV